MDGFAPFRLELAELAERYLAGEIEGEAFWSRVPEPGEDADVAELLLLLEHVPVVGGRAGVSELEAERFADRLREAIARLRG